MAENKLEKSLKGPQGLSVVPDFLKDEKPEGLGHLQEADVQMPRLLIAQQMSPQLNPDKPVYMEDLKTGDLFNSLTGAVYGRGPLQFTVVRADSPRWVEFIPREQGGGIKDPKVPYGDPRTEWQADGKPPIATKFYDFIIVLLPSNEFISLSLKSTGIRVARVLNGLMQARMKPIYTGVYALDSVSTSNAKGTFFVPRVKNAGWITQEQHGFLKEAFDSLKHSVIDIHMPEATGAEPINEEEDTSFDTAAMDAQAETSGM